MTKPYCLTIEVKSEHIENGLGYLVAFSLPQGNFSPDQMPEFGPWSERVRSAVLRAGDQPFNPDPYTRKVAIAQLMHTLQDINKEFGIQIGNTGTAPAVQIHSTNPFDNKIHVDFTGEEGEFHVEEYGLNDGPRPTVKEHGKTRIIEGGGNDFPFDKVSAVKPHSFRPRF